MLLGKLANISKSFGPVQALSHVMLDIYEGEVLGLVGDNAAGKSTLMKVLTGAYQPDEGTIYFDCGRRYEGDPVLDVCYFATPEDSRRVGIEMVYQDLALVGSLDVAANVFLGREEVRWKFGPLGVLDTRRMRDLTAEMLGRLSIQVQNAQETVEHLSGGQRQAIAIGRASFFDAKLVIMDEPTAALSVNAIKQVGSLIQALKARGIAVVLISHRLDDVISLADRIVVLYQGRMVAEFDPKTNLSLYTRDQVLRAMEGVGAD